MTTPFVGEIRLFGFPRIPSGWVACDGGLLPVAQYEALFSLLGTSYGGDGVNSFAVPDLRGRLPMHQGTGPGLSPRVIGESGGSEKVTLIQTQMPPHQHALQATSSAASATVPGGNLQMGALADDAMYLTDTSGASVVPLSAASISPAGGNQPHDNLMPTQTVSFCISCNGIYPSQT